MRLRLLPLSGSVSLLALGQALAQTVPSAAPENIGAVEGSATGPVNPSLPPVPVTASQFAPNQQPLSAIQPTSVISAQTLTKIAVPPDDSNDVLLLTPSAPDISPAGPGLQQDFGQSIRGLQYTEFTVDWDGIPVPGFPFNLAPQPGAYFLSRDFSSITVNRGPGQASAIGQATFGGYTELASQDPLDTPQVQPYGTFGSFGTKFFGIEANTGAIAQTGGTRALIDLTREEADGADTGISTERRNLFAKIEQPIGDSTVITYAINADNDVTKTPYGATLQSISLYGRNFNFNQDPTGQFFADYNHDDYTTDFQYLQVHSFLGGGWTIDNKAYQTEYIQRDQRVLDPGGNSPDGGPSPNIGEPGSDVMSTNGIIYLRGNTPVDATNDVPGFFNHLDFEDWGDVLRMSKDFSFGQLRFGIWGDREGFTTYGYNMDLSRNSTLYTTTPDAASPFADQYFSDFITIQPYAEFAWKPRSDLTVTAGIKYSSVTRNIDGANYNGAPTNIGSTFNEPLPSFDVNYRPLRGMAVYFQAAEGFLAPQIGVTGNPVTVQPSTTWSYQIGTTYHRKWLSVGTDLYLIDYIDNITQGGFTTYFNGGGASFKGVEFEGTALLGGGFAFYVNGSLNDSAYDSNGNNLAQTPRRTAAAALLYDQGSILRANDELYGNIVGKVVGPQYAVDTPNNGAFDSVPIKSWNEVDLSAGYVLPAYHRHFRFGVNVANLFDHQSLTGYDGLTLEGQPLYWVQAGRSIFFSVAAYL